MIFLFFSFRWPGFSSSAIFLCEIPGSIWHSCPPPPNGWTEASSSALLCEPHAQFH